ncbi:hypothetical protein [uncultured Dysosmobacter sp.]|uniref:hypothetical protein n=1 Tax=uncultured Dysosmobacter sp. TaxID=2591384 RepID=UPI0026329644|nr:hypothetical protein [uncultured Dysosmobacter sp.]
MNLSLYEQETIINFNEEEKAASIYTHNKALIRKLDKLAQERPGDCRREKTSHEGKAVDFIIPKGWMRIYPPRTVGEAQRQALEKARNALKTAGRADV